MIKKVTRKSFKIRPSGRSTDFISPSFGYGCLANCTYCYMKRHKPIGLDVATNVDSILHEIYIHSLFTTLDKPNQTHEKYITYDISCNEDFALHHKYYNWRKIFDFFKNSDNLLGSFATKFVVKELLNYNPDKKIRIRFSLMPQNYANELEPNTSLIKDRLIHVNKFIEAGYEVHLNFSPVIVKDGWLNEYERLFKLCDIFIDDKYKNEVKAEVIFLTHNINKHYYNQDNNLTGENLIWKPSIQESKISQYGGNNIRYKLHVKSKVIKEFKQLHNNIIPWNTIRYIF